MRRHSELASRYVFGLLLATTTAAAAAGCRVYKRDLLEQTAAPDAGAMPDGTPGPGTDSGLADAGGSMHDPNSCSWGECWWSQTAPDGCRTAGMPLPGDRPPGADDSTPIGDIYLGFYQVRLGTTDRSGQVTEDAWQEFGLDLDGICTNSSTCGGSSEVSCRTTGPSIPFDGLLCRDNTFARLQPVIAAVPELGEKFGLSEDAFNCQLWRGSYTMIMRVSDYNGEPNDPRVRVDLYTSPGIEEEVPWTCPSEDFMDRYPRWLSSRKFSVDKSWLAGPVEQSGVLPNSKFATPDAYVRDGYLVAHMPDDTKEGFVGDGMPHRGFMLNTQKAVYVGHLIKDQAGTWQIRDGLSAGRIRKQDLVESFRNIGFCEAGELSTWYESMLTYVEENADVLANGANDPNQDCDAMSFAIGFEGAQLQPGSAVEVPEPIECCAPGKTREQCLAQCGDGVVSGDEKCDTAIAPGAPGACPTMCERTDACVPAVVKGSECAAECVAEPITMVGARDGCCPEGANTATDVDCGAVCGNSVVERGETCDPPSSCTPCVTTNPCLAATTTGSAETCDLRCEVSPVRACSTEAADQCCPEGCNSRTDRDCSMLCGNGRIDAGETCEAGTSQPCPTSCDDDDACTRDTATGSTANCNLVCAHERITETVDGDGCCPPGASANSDSDCQARCGNSVVEGSEQCDDGNTTAGDGCYECQTETPEQMCLAALGVDDACARCTCARCAAPAIACYGHRDPNEVALCRNMIECGREAACGNPDCFCGTFSLISCLGGRANGPCRDQVIAAAKTSSLLEISERSTDPAFPLGRANAVSGCVDTNCAAECGR